MSSQTKLELRKTYKAKRELLTLDEVNQWSKKIKDILFSRIMMHRFSPIHIYLPIIPQKEVDTWPIINLLRQDFAPDIYISKSLSNSELVHVLFAPNTALETNKWHILEPQNYTDTLNSSSFFDKYKTEDILVIMPLICFDKNGNRIGYGKGYYDNFLAFSGENTTKIGLSFFEPIEQIEGLNAKDVKLNYCVTPTKIWSF